MMRLLTYDGVGKLCVTRDLPDGETTSYAILSHTWGRDEEEVTFHEVGSLESQAKAGYTKIALCGQQAKQDGWQYFWVDTCCIDKANYTELSKAITSMYRWYQRTEVCYVYLADVSSQSGQDMRTNDRVWESSFRRSRWFTRGWTLQELLAPRNVVFYSKEWDCLGTKHELKELLCNITGISILALEGHPITEFPVVERMRWTRSRQTKEKEDEAYCLLGIFGVYMYLNYGEGDNAFRRLQRELDAQVQSGTVLGPNTASLAKSAYVRSLGLCFASAPYLQQDFFIGRANEIQRIHHLLSQENVPRIQRRVVLGGIGGIGKTQLAIAYASRHEENYTSVLWLNATSKQTLYASFQSIAEQVTTMNELEKLDQDQVLKRILGWLSEPNNNEWLLIFDNYDDPDQFDIGGFCPNTSHGSIIMTTRLPDQVDGEPVQVQPLLALEESLDVLQSRSRRKDVKDNAGARALAMRLAGLPIALVTAGSYLRHNHITFQEYLEAYEKRWQVGRQPVSPLEYQDRTLYNTWNLTYSLLVTKDAEAAQLLKLVAYFDYQEMWYELFQAGLPENMPDWLPKSFTDRINFGDLMGTLVKYGLLEIHHVSQSYSMYRMHSCVHDWTLGSLNQDLNPQLYRYAFTCVANSIHETIRGGLGQIKHVRVSRHAVRLTHHRFQLDDRLTSVLVEYYRKASLVGQMLKDQIQPSAAEYIYVRAVAGYEQALGSEHIQTLEMMHNLGILYRDHGKLVDAEQTYLRVLAGKEKILGEDSTSVLNTINSLGILYSDQGKLVEAEQMYVRVLSGKIFEFDTDLSTNYGVGNLANLYADQGRYAEAERLYHQVLDVFQRSCGLEHHQTLLTLNNIGFLYNEQGKLAQAEQTYNQALAIYERLLAPEHTSTLRTVDNLGLLYNDQGRLVEAEQMYLRALLGYEKGLGPDHILTLDTTRNLGILYHDQGKLVEAEQMCLRAMAGYQKVLDEEHPSRLEQLLNHANLCLSQHNPERAKQLYRTIINKCPKDSFGTTSRSQSMANTYAKALGTLVGLLNNTCTEARAHLLSLVEFWRQEDNDNIVATLCLARALLDLKDDGNAQIILTRFVTDGKSEPLDMGGVRCDACHHRLNISMGMNACRSCVNTTLCDTFLSRKIIGPCTVTICHHDEFFSFADSFRQAQTSSENGILVEMDAWIKELRQKYQTYQ